MMLKNYFKIAFRNILKFKIYSLINIIGLAVSISACILISLWVMDELSYDRFNKNADRIYRPCISGRMSNREISSATGPAPLGETLRRDLPEVESYTRIWASNSSEVVIRSAGKVFNEKHFLSVDSSFFEVFTGEFIKGNPKTALISPKTVVLTESTARKYFGSENPIGKILNVNKNCDYMVTGIIKDFPTESHFHFDILGSLSSLGGSRNPYWGNINCYTYILLKNGTNKIELQKKINNELRKYFGPQLKAASGFSLEQFEAEGNRYRFFLESLTSIHLHSHLDYEIEANGNISYVYIFSCIALAILLIACINFINLSTARSERRATEVGIRKTLGSHKPQIAGQFIIESILTSLISVIISIGIVEFLIPLFNNIADKHITFNLLNNIYTLPLIISFAVVIGLAAGSYPAFYLSSFQPVQVLKSSIRKTGRKSALRSSLVIFQFTISIILIVGTFVIYNQLKYIREKDLGFNKEQVLVIDKTYDVGDIESFRNALSKNPNIIGISNSTAIPGKLENKGNFNLKGTPNLSVESMDEMNCDYEFQKTYRMNMVKGRFFSKEHSSDTISVVLNESAAKVFNITKLDGAYLVDSGRQPAYQIIGIIKDFNFSSLHEAIRPLVIFPYRSKSFGEFLSVRTKPGNYANTLSFLQNTWKKYAGDEAMDYSFLDQKLQHLYLTDQRTSKIALIFSALAILIACLGLLGLVAFITEQRTKEIGIRKVLGASVPEIMVLLSKELTKWVLVANIIAWPLAYYLMSNWLKNFAYRINITLWVFFLSGLLALLIALLTMSVHAIKAATANPVKSLKYE
ncbi:MAG: ABC transporter permease [Ignavibacteriaceae bacterium]|nr:ABC transporter permease [Ignavibacteriaceae bacterium]